MRCDRQCDLKLVASKSCGKIREGGLSVSVRVRARARERERERNEAGVAVCSGRVVSNAR